MSNTEDIELEARIEPNGDLTLLANQATRDHLTELEDDTDFSNAMFDLFERWSSNGSYTLFDAAQGNPFVGLTSAPCIAECIDHDDNGEAEIVGRCWWFPNYQVTSYAEELRTKGQTTFALAED